MKTSPLMGIRGGLNVQGGVGAKQLRLKVDTMDSGCLGSSPGAYQLHEVPLNKVPNLCSLRFLICKALTGL